MPKAKRLPSGSWHCQVYRNGKRYSFTVKDPSDAGRRKCERIAGDFADRAEHEEGFVITVINNYIERKSRTLSVSTLAAYRSLARNAYGLIAHEQAATLSQAAVEAWIAAYRVNHTPKTIRNAYGLLCASVGRSFNVTLPEAAEKDYYTPTDEDVRNLIEAVRGTDLERAVLLAAFATLREGEICALTVDDFTKDSVTVSRAMAWDGSGYVTKAPKTATSARTVMLPEAIVERILDGKTDRIVKYTPKNLSTAFARKLKRTGLPAFRFHDLRAYAASIRHALGVPDVYIMADGGWKTDNILKTVYRRAMADKRRTFAEVSGEHFEKLI